MRKALYLLIVALAFVLVSCATTNAQDIPAASAEALVEDIYGEHTFTTDMTFKFILQFAEDLKGDDKSIKVTSDEKNNSVKIEGFVLEALVGPLAQSGEAMLEMELNADGNKATCTIRYTDSWGSISVGPLTKKVSMGITSAGIEFYNTQVQMLLALFQGSMPNYALQYAYENGWLDEHIAEYEKLLQEYNK